MALAVPTAERCCAGAACVSVVDGSGPCFPPGPRPGDAGLRFALRKLATAEDRAGEQVAGGDGESRFSCR